jgi:hypothetical protein
MTTIEAFLMSVFARFWLASEKKKNYFELK